MIRAVAVSAVVVLLLVASACTGSDLAVGPDGRPAGDTVELPNFCVPGNYDSFVPWSSLTDLVTYGDAMVLVEITGETGGLEPRNKGRILDARIVDVLWQNPYRPAPPNLLQMKGPNASWVKLEVGKRYVTVVGYFSQQREPVIIAPLNAQARWPVEDGRLAAGCVDSGPTEELDGMTLEEAARRVAETPIPEAAIPHMHLPIWDRATAIP